MTTAPAEPAECRWLPSAPPRGDETAPPPPPHATGAPRKALHRTPQAPADPTTSPAGSTLTAVLLLPGMVGRDGSKAALSAASLCCRHLIRRHLYGPDLYGPHCKALRGTGAKLGLWMGLVSMRRAATMAAQPAG
eukprot:1161191-Pelagomonas_calceolata.AAC.10